MTLAHLTEAKKRHLEGNLEWLCQQFELTPTQHRDAEQKYLAVGDWLDQSDDMRLHGCLIYPQGSMRLGTTVRPYGRDDFDLDLVIQLRPSSDLVSPAEVKQVIGDRLKDHGVYKPLLLEQNRCWRLNYAESSHFHLDIMPCVPAQNGAAGSVCVPDRDLEGWSASNPSGYATWFQEIAAKEPVAILKRMTEAAAVVEPLPEQVPIKGTIARTVQLAKRHRDIYFGEHRYKVKPISIILTTLLARTYDALVSRRTYTSQIKLIYDVLAECKNFIEVHERPTSREFWVTNPKNEEENFAEKWNSNPDRAKAFFEWRERALSDLGRLSRTEGLDEYTRILGKLFGDKEARSVHSKSTEAISAARYI